MLNPYLRQYGDVKLSKITSISLQKYLMNKNWSKQYRVLEKVVLFRFYKYCYEVGLINEDITQKVVLPKVKKTIEDVQKAKEKFLDRVEMKKFLDYLKKYDSNKVFRLFTEFMYLTGLRFGEATALQWEDIDFDNQKYTLYSKSKQEYILTTPKTINSYRKVYYNNRVNEIFMELIGMAGKVEGFVFLHNQAPILNTTFNHYLNTKFKLSKIEKSATFSMTSHVLRHSHISLLAELEIPIKVIMERVGHGDEKTTLLIYNHVTATMKYNLKSKLELIE